MSTNRRASLGYTLFPACPAVSDTPKETISQIMGQDTPAVIRKVADISNMPSGENANNDRTTNNPLVLVNRRNKNTLKMNRLIPLKLGHPSDIDTRSISPPPASTSETKCTIVRARTIKRLRPGPATNLVILPYTDQDWKTVMDEVKNLYLKGQYKHCSMQCKQILEGIIDSHRIHPLYIIYLSFFAASSLEMTASSLHNNSSKKLPLYQEALSYYQAAASSLEYASFSANSDLIYASKQSSSLPSSARSSVESVFSHHSAFSSVTSSPPASIESEAIRGRGRNRSPTTSAMKPQSQPQSEDEKTTPSAPRTGPKKKVSFSPSTPASPLAHHHPSTSTTSLTLYLMTPAPTTSESSLLDSFPSPPASRPQTPPDKPISSLDPEPIVTILSEEEARAKEEEAAISAYLLKASLARYRALLETLEGQLGYHVIHIQDSINALALARQTKEVSVHSKVNGSEDASKDNSDGKKAELRERVAMLKARGWERKRFDGEKYQRLAELALGEVEEARV